jgi:hypothetical protein
MYIWRGPGPDSFFLSMRQQLPVILYWEACQVIIEAWIMYTISSGTLITLNLMPIFVQPCPDLFFIFFSV